LGAGATAEKDEFLDISLAIETPLTSPLPRFAGGEERKEWTSPDFKNEF
jgi:hypothetical protein